VRRNAQALITVALLMLIVSVLGFLLNIAASYRYVSVSADVLFDMRLAGWRSTNICKNCRHDFMLVPDWVRSFRVSIMMSRRFSVLRRIHCSPW
jgi:ATP-binding cassette subfamily B protein